jgi:regulator of RNase E activity RraA
MSQIQRHCNNQIQQMLTSYQHRSRLCGAVVTVAVQRSDKPYVMGLNPIMRHGSRVTVGVARKRALAAKSHE